MKKSILILGKSGMLGSMVYHYLSRNPNFVIFGTEKSSQIKSNSKILFFDAVDFLRDKKNFSFLNNYDYIINCIGIIKPYCQDNDPEGVVKAIQVNALFPHELSSFCPKINIIQIATDCVFSGKEGKSKENKPHDPLDVYGKTKSLGEVHKNNFLNLRCSIIGPENKHKKSLLEWFLGQKENSVLKGFTHHYWNGITTLQFAKVCEKIISQNIFSEMIKIQHTHHVVINNTVTKYELLNIFKTIFHKKVKIVKVNDIGPKTDRSLSSLYSTINPENTLIPMKKAIGDLSDYIDRYNYYERQ